MLPSVLREPASPSVFRERFERPVLAAILGVTALALLARLAFLGDRVAHFDEARVAYGVLRYLKTGIWQYDPTRHGPFLPHVNRWVFALIGPSDLSARLVVALAGGLLPLSAYLFREHLDEAELVGLAVVFAADPILLYYSRFMRNDVLVAAFSVAGFGLLVRLSDTGTRRYLYAGVFSLALAFTAKENAVLYPITILGGLGLVFGNHLLLDLLGHGNPLVTIRARAASMVGGLWRINGSIAGGTVLFLAVIVFFYAPRNPTDGVGLWRAVAHPTLLPDVVETATIGTAEKIERIWIGGPFQSHPYRPFLDFLVSRIVYVSWPVAVLAVVGYARDVWGFDRPNVLVSTGFYWGVASLLGYPAAMSVRAAWTGVHVLVPLAFPAAAGAAAVYRWGRAACLQEDRRRAGVAVLVLAVLLLFPLGAGFYTSYVSPHGNILVQYSQPEDDMHPAIHAAQDAARDTPGLDVLWFGDRYYVEDESMAYTLGVRDGEWYNRLPVPWYFEIANATIDSVPTDSLANLFDAPPVVVTCKNGKGCPSGVERARVADGLDDYVRFPPYEANHIRGRNGTMYVFFVARQYAEGYR